MSDNIKVVVKVRPLIPREIDQKLSFQWRVRNNTLYQLDESANEFGPSFTFDKIYDETTKTVEVYNDVAKPIVESAIGGINGTIFAYGQTSSGKTYTMTGTEDSPGIIPLSVNHLFEVIKTKTDRDFLVRVSYIEIYNETVRDLLDDDKKNIRIYDTNQGVKFDATEKPASSPEEVLAVMREGEVNRQTGATNMNEESSRSHSIFQITIESRKHVEGEEEAGCVNVSQLNLVDLAGSERAGQTGATGLRFKEGTHINKSLSVLALVIKQLSENPNQHANYRDSKLTRILQNSIGGNAKTSIICAVTPASVEETISTLQFANRAKSIKNKPEVNAVATNATKIHDLLNQLTRLKTQLESKKNLEQDNVNLQRQIAGLQKFILNGLSRPVVDVASTGRKKWQQPMRRVTISTLHPIEEDPVSNVSTPALPSYCTPSLKYNPLTLGQSDFMPIQNSSQLLTVPEDPKEPPRLVTPPPRTQNVVDIINLDSDDENPQEPCSPYHICIDKSRTPPCVLRKAAQEAEKKFNDILELTEREKIYTPSVVELLEKLEENSIVISELQEKISVMSNESQEKDARLKTLQRTMEETEARVKELISEKVELEIKCSNYNTKLTDLEVIHETFIKKSKTREEELLSLLKDQEKKVSRCDKSTSTTMTSIDRDSQFLEMSNISLVSSDTENSLAESTDDVIKYSTTKYQSSLQCESKLFAGKQKIYLSEAAKNDLQRTIQTLENKLSQVVNENDVLKSTVKNLMSNIEAQKETIRIAHDDIKSYNGLIQELQIKLNEKNSFENDNFESNLENMMVNEDRLTANNENMKNIIQTMRNTLEDKKKNDILKAEKEIAYWKEQVQIKEEEIKSLMGSVESLSTLANESKIAISDLQILKEELTNKLREAEKNNDLLQKENEEHNIHLNEKEILIKELIFAKEELAKKFTETELNNNELLKQDEKNKREINILLDKNNNLVNVLAEKEKLENDLKETITVLKTQNKELLNRINNLELEINTKTDLLKSNSDVQKDIKNKLFESILKKLNEIRLQISSCELTNIPEDVNDDSFIELFISALNDKNYSETMSLKTELETLSKERNERLQEIESLEQKVEKLKHQLSETHQELDNKGSEISKLEAKLKDAKEANENLRNELLSKDNIVSSLRVTVSDLLKETEYLSLEINKKNTALTLLEKRVNELSAENEHLNQEATEKSSYFAALEEQVSKLNEENKKISSLAALKERVNELNTENEYLRQEVIEKLASLTDLKEQVKELTLENKTLKQEMNAWKLQTNHAPTLMENTQNLNDNNHDYETKLNFLCILVENKNNDISRLRKNIFSLRNKQPIEKILHEIIATKDQQISALTEKLNCVEKQLKLERDNVISLTEELATATNNGNNLLSLILDSAKNILSMWTETTYENNTSESNLENQNIPLHEHVIQTLQAISKNIKAESEKDKLSEAQVAITELAQNAALVDECDHISVNNEELLDKKVIEQVNNDLQGSYNVLKQLKLELKDKADEIDFMKVKTTNIKEEFVEYQSTVSEQMESLRKENDKLKKKLALSKENNYKSEDECNQSTEELSNTSYENLKERNIKESLDKNSKLASPQSLVTICYNKIMERIQPQGTNTMLSSNMKSMSAPRDVELACACIELNIQLKEIKEERQNLLSHVTDLETLISYLTYERDDLRQEVQTLLELIDELHKKIVNHRTNLSTLTATTYAENKLLNSQLKVLQHHHTRCISLCQRDIPAFKIQLQELMGILKSSDFEDKQHVNYKRYSLPDVLVNETTTLKNESILDGDLLMLDTNVTFSMSDETLVGQTFLDTTQKTEVACQSNEEPLDLDQLKLQMKFLIDDNQKLRKTLEHVKQENSKLRSDIEFYLSKREEVKSDNLADTLAVELKKELEILTQDLLDIRKAKQDIERKYSDLVLEIPSSEALVKKICVLENDLKHKTKENSNLINEISQKSKTIKDLQKENCELSNQLMENISEVDDLKTQLELYNKQKIDNNDKAIIEKLQEELDLLKKEPEFLLKNTSKEEASQALQIKATPEHCSKLNRSLSDSGNSFRYHKILTLQHELNQSKEDCKKITEEVATIKTDLGQPMDLDESIGETGMQTYLRKPIFPKIVNSDQLDEYTADKIDCINFLAEKTETNKNAFGFNVKVIDLMQFLYTHLISKHNNEIENLNNKLNDFEVTKNELEKQFKDVSVKYSNLQKEIHNEQIIKTDVSFLKNIKDELLLINNEITNNSNKDISKVFAIYMEHVLKPLDAEFCLNSANTFNSLLQYVLIKNKNDVENVMKANAAMKDRLNSLLTELETTKDNLDKMKSQMIEQEKEYNHLNEQKKSLNELFLSLQNDLANSISNVFAKLKDQNLMMENELDISLPVAKNVNIMFCRLLDELQRRNLSHDEELTFLKIQLQDKENELKTQKASLEMLDQIRSLNVMISKEKEIFASELEKSNCIIKQNKEEMDKMTADILQLRDSMKENINLIDAMKTEAKSMLEENLNLKEKLNEKTQDCIRLEMNVKTLEKSAEIQNNMIKRLQKQKEAYENLKTEKDVKIEELISKCTALTSECDTLNTNIKMYKKQIDDLKALKSSLETRVSELQLECEQNYRLPIEAITNNAQRRRKSIQESNRMFSNFEVDFEAQQNKIQELFDSREPPQDLFMEVDECEADSNRSTPLRLSKDRDSFNIKQDQNEREEENLSRPSSVLSIRRRRQSMYDQRRSVVGATPSPDRDRNQELKGSKEKINSNSSSMDRRDSINTDNEEEHHSRPSSVNATRRRRQSMYDQRRSVAAGSLSPENVKRKLKASQANTNITSDKTDSLSAIDLTNIRDRLAQTEKELEELKERYRELDEECETCAQYLQERDRQCAALRKEKIALEKALEELRQKKFSETKPNMINVSVNTDEDWAHLHSVVVDRMSFDAEVEKNKKLTKTVEELRYSKQELNNVIAKMQKALAKHTAGRDHRELEAVKSELKSCKEELSELKERYRELDDECETCAQLLREREEQCRKLKEAKAALEAKLEEYEEEEKVASVSRRRRQHAHDARRAPTPPAGDVATQTADDLSNQKLERDENLSQTVHESLIREIASLKLAYENVCKEKMALEHMLASRQPPVVHPTMFVSTGSGIVQSQQITDLMKENHKLKKVNAKLIHLCKKRGKTTQGDSTDKEEQTG